MNLEYKDKILIAKITAAQVLFGALFLIRAFLAIVIFIGNVVYSATGMGLHIDYNPIKIVIEKEGELKNKTIDTHVDLPKPPKNLCDYDFKGEAQKAKENAVAQLNAILGAESALRELLNGEKGDD